MKHPVSGEVKEVSEQEFLALFDESVREKIKSSARTCKAEVVVCCEVLQMDSSQFGKRTVLCLGPHCTYPVSEIEKGLRLGDVPSRFQYPTVLWRCNLHEVRP